MNRTTIDPFFKVPGSVCACLNLRISLTTEPMFLICSVASSRSLGRFKIILWECITTLPREIASPQIKNGMVKSHLTPQKVIKGGIQPQSAEVPLEASIGRSG